MSEVQTEFLFEMDVELEDNSLVIGGTPEGMRLVAYVTGGTFEGPRLRGTIPPGGGDWATIRSDGSLKADVRVCLTTHDGVNIYATYGGRIVMPPELMGVLGNREAAAATDPSKYYFRTAPMFEVASNSPYAWLNGIVAVSLGRLTRKGVAYRVFAVK